MRDIKEKQCTACKNVLPVREFETVMKRGYEFRRSECRTCRKEYNTRWNKKHGYKKKEYSDRICEECGKVFTPKIVTQRYCGDPCVYKQERPQKFFNKKKCENCGTVFVPKRKKQRYCRNPCTRMEAKEKPCEYCGKMFAGKRYCSPVCWAKARKHQRAENRARYLRTDKGKEYSMKHSKRHEAKRAERMVFDIPYTSAMWKFTLEHFGGRCLYCGSGGKMTKDHYVPLSKGGDHYMTNIVPACMECNIEKSNDEYWVGKRDNARSIRVQVYKWQRAAEEYLYAVFGE